MTRERLAEAVQALDEFKQVEKVRAAVAARDFAIDVEDGDSVSDSISDDAYRRIAATLRRRLASQIQHHHPIGDTLGTSCAFEEGRDRLPAHGNVGEALASFVCNTRCEPVCDALRAAIQ